MDRSIPFLALQFAAALAQAAAGESAIARLDPAVDALVAPGAPLQTVFEHETFFEGPHWIQHGDSGYLIFSDVPGNAIDELNPDGSVSVYLDKVFAGKDSSNAYQSMGGGGLPKFFMVGPNGVTTDRAGSVVYCAMSDGKIVRVEADGRRTVLASYFGTQHLNAPNDLVYGSDGSLYFTDSRAGTNRVHSAGVPHKGLYVLREGQVRLLSKDINHPNGVALSPDEKYLYVTNTLVENILRFDVQPEGIANPIVFVDMSGDSADGGPDGIKVDRTGNVYSTGPGGVWILSPEGKHLGTIQTPRQITNLAFGDGDLKTLYMTGLGAVYRISLKVSGK